jgi:hypothetical protein
MKRLFSTLNLAAEGISHKQIDKLADGFRVNHGNFPWHKLRDYVDACIKKQKGISIPEGLDLFLISFVQKHSRKDVAVAAVAHALSTEATLSLLNGTLRVKADDFNSIPDYVLVLLAVNHVNPTAVTEIEANRGRAILSLWQWMHIKSTELWHRTGILFTHGVPESSLLFEHIRAIAEHVFSALSAELSSNVAKSHWHRAFCDISWISHLPESVFSFQPGHLSLTQVLDDKCANWRSWAAWKPDQDILAIFSTKLDDSDRKLLEGILALEGPCFENANMPTLKHSYIYWASETNSTHLRTASLEIIFTSSEHAHVQKVLTSLTAKLLQALTAGVSTDSSWLQLFKQICVGNPIDEKGLQLMEECFNIGSTAIINDVQSNLQSQRDQTLTPISSVVHLVSAFDTAPCQRLQQLFGAQVLDAARQIIQARQNHLRRVINVDRKWREQDEDTLEKLHRFGEALKSSAWVISASGPGTRSLLLGWPSIEQIQDCFSIRMKAQGMSAAHVNGITNMVDEWLLYRLAERGKLAEQLFYSSLTQVLILSNLVPINQSSIRLMESLFLLWRSSIKPEDEDRRTVGLLIAQPGATLGCDFRCQCLEQLPHLETSFVGDLRRLLENRFSNPQEACIVMAQSLFSTYEADVILCWRALLARMMEQQGEKLVQYALNNLGIDAWLQFLENIGTIFADGITGSLDQTSPLLQPDLHKWSAQLNTSLDIVKRLEGSNGMAFSPAMQCILRGGTPELEGDIEIILSYLGSTFDESRWDAMQRVTARLEKNGKNSTLIRKSMSFLRSASPDGTEACSHILETYEEVSLLVAEAILSAWYHNNDLMPYDKHALEAVAEILNIELEETDILETMEATDAYIEEQVTELLLEARRLEGLRAAFKLRDPEWVSKILKKLGIEDSSPLDDILENLPTELVDVVERISETEVELHFPLSTLTPLQKKAMGAGTAQSLLVRFIPPMGGLPAGFCMHFDHESRDVSDATGHFPWLVFGEDGPEEPYCHGRATPAVFQLSRILSQYLSAAEFSSLQNMYTLVADSVSALSSKCIICSVPHAFNLRRSTVCVGPECKTILDRSCLETRLSDIRHDPATVDLLLAMVYATACAGDLTLLPGCPITVPNTLKEIINALPPISQLQQVDSLEAIVSSLDHVRGAGSQTAQLLAWVCTSYRGFLSSATDSLKIPSLPGSHQFVLANAAPNLEISFAAKVGRGPTRVVFHGTTLDRLHSILSQGLKELSGTTLQRHGHSYGKGIYVASDPATAWGYATHSASSWTGSNFSNFRILLGCELAGTWAAASGNIHVITDPSCLMVRYIFLLPNHAAMPLVQHVTPAMSSVFASLRSGAL